MQLHKTALSAGLRRRNTDTPGLSDWRGSAWVSSDIRDDKKEEIVRSTLTPGRVVWRQPHQPETGGHGVPLHALQQEREGLPGVRP